MCIRSCFTLSSHRVNNTTANTDGSRNLTKEVQNPSLLPIPFTSTTIIADACCFQHFNAVLICKSFLDADKLKF